jgi:hypothetical protein
MLAGCAPGTTIDELPSGVGLPAGTPSRPATSYQYPAVHDMPPPRATKPLDEQQQQQLKQNLETVRDRQEQRTGTAPKAAPKRKNNTTDPKMPSSDSGARENP